MTNIKIVSPVESIYECIQHWIQQEIKPGGILSDVQLFLHGNGHYDSLDTPLLWIEKTEITSQPISHGNYTTLSVPVSIICADEVIDTLNEAELSTCNLACRVITSLLLNTIESRPVANNIILKDFRLERLYPVENVRNTFEIRNKTMMLAATRVDTRFLFEVDWTRYETITAGGVRGVQLYRRDGSILDDMDYSSMENYVDG